ncbi:hypothetical protein SPFM12_00144 [Salmonella phage SPFM12]|nr:hypothetical protein SPFM12_00144 [Salmonella phage SPFM12]
MLITGIQNDPKVIGECMLHCTITRYKTSELATANKAYDNASNLMATLVARGVPSFDPTNFMASFKNGRMDVGSNFDLGYTGKKYMGFLTYGEDFTDEVQVEDLVVNDILSALNHPAAASTSCIQYTGSITFMSIRGKNSPDDIPEQYVYLNVNNTMRINESKRTAFAQNLNGRYGLNLVVFKNMTPQVTAPNAYGWLNVEGRGYIGPQTFRYKRLSLNDSKAITPTASGANTEIIIRGRHAENPDAVLPMGLDNAIIGTQEAIMALYSLSQRQYLYDAIKLGLAGRRKSSSWLLLSFLAELDDTLCTNFQGVMYLHFNAYDPKKPVEGANTAYNQVLLLLKGANVLYVGSTTDDGTASGELNKVVPELWVASDEPADYNPAFLKVQAKGVIAGDSAFPVASEAKGQGYIYSYGVDCTAIERLSLVVTQTKLDGLVYPDGHCYAYLGSIPVKIGAKPQVGVTNPNDPDPAPVDHVITFKEVKLTEDDIVPAAIPENTNPPHVKLPKTTTDLLTTLNTQYGYVTYNRLEGSALFRNVTAYLDRNTSMTLTAKKNSGYIGTQELELSKITLGTPTPISDEGAVNKTSDQLVLDFINEKNPDAVYLHYNDPD